MLLLINNVRIKIVLGYHRGPERRSAFFSILSWTSGPGPRGDRTRLKPLSLHDSDVGFGVVCHGLALRNNLALFCLSDCSLRSAPLLPTIFA